MWKRGCGLNGSTQWALIGSFSWRDEDDDKEEDDDNDDDGIVLLCR